MPLVNKSKKGVYFQTIAMYSDVIGLSLKSDFEDISSKEIIFIDSKIIVS